MKTFFHLVIQKYNQLIRYFSRSFYLFFHSVRVHISPQDTTSATPYISGGGLSDNYLFGYFEIHWGSDDEGSEHAIDGMRYANDNMDDCFPFEVSLSQTRISVLFLQSLRNDEFVCTRYLYPISKQPKH